MLERTDAITNEVLEPITFVLAYQLYIKTDQSHVFYNSSFTIIPFSSLSSSPSPLPPPPYSSYSMALRPIFGPWPHRFRGFETLRVLWGPTTNPQPGGPVSLFRHLAQNLSGPSGSWATDMCFMFAVAAKLPLSHNYAVVPSPTAV
jgi:hypothetical protein